MILSKRLQVIVQHIDGQCLADIGCDHGYVVIEALRKHRVKKAYACDVAQGPLDNAKRNIEEAHLQEQASCLLMDGLSKLPEDVDTIVIAGMGGQLIVELLKQGRSNLQVGTKLILSPHKDAHSLRQYLNAHGFIIEKEQVIQEDRHFYILLQVVYTRSALDALSDVELEYGVHVKKDEDYKNFLDHELAKWKQIEKKRPMAQKKEAADRCRCIEQLKKAL